MDTLQLINNVEILYYSWGNIIIFLGSFIETLPIGFLIPGGLIVALGGFYSFGNKLSLTQVILSGSFGMTLAFMLGYLIGRKTGFFLITKFHQEKNAKVAKLLLQNHGPLILTTSLLANLTRFWISFISGVEKYNFFKFMFFASFASLTWNSLLVTLGLFAGSKRGDLEKGIAGLGALSWLLILIVFAIVFFGIRREYKLLKS